MFAPRSSLSRPILLALSLTLPTATACSPSANGDGPNGGKTDDLGAGQLIVNEIAAHPDIDVNGDGKVDTKDEYIELVNTGGSAANLEGIEIADGNKTRFTFPADSMVPAGGAALVIAKPGTFSAPTGAVVFTAGTLGLNNDNDSITVRQGDDVLEKHGYNMATTERRSWNLSVDGNRDAIFQLTKPSPGTRMDGSFFGGSILSADQAESILARLDDECPDTFCGGDFSYFFVDGAGSLSCLGDGTCNMTLEVKPAVDDKFQTTVLDGVNLGSLVAVDPKGTYVGKVTGSVTKDTFANDQDVFVTLACELNGDYFTASDVVQDNGRPTEAFRDNILDCLTGEDGLDFPILGNLPSFDGLLTEFERNAILLSLHQECPDTFCGGDFSFFFTDDDGSLHCTNDGVCELEMAVTPSVGGEWLSDPTSGLGSEELTTTTADMFTFTATGSKVRDGETFVTARCDLFENTFNAEDIYDRDFDEPTEGFRDLLLECIIGAETTVLPRLPTN